MGYVPQRQLSRVVATRMLVPAVVTVLNGKSSVRSWNIIFNWPTVDSGSQMGKAVLH